MPIYTYTTLGDPSATAGTSAYGINDSGQIVGYYVQQITTTPNPKIPIPVTTTYDHGFLYSGGTYANIDYPGAGPLPSSGATGGTFAQGINTSGQIVGYYNNWSPSPSPVFHGFLYSGGAYTAFDVPDAGSGGSTVAQGINASGQIVGFYTNNSGTHGFLYDPAGNS
jgi:probable HAF family extracellular repeat protein